MSPRNFFWHEREGAGRVRGGGERRGPRTRLHPSLLGESSPDPSPPHPFPFRTTLHTPPPPPPPQSSDDDEELQLEDMLRSGCFVVLTAVRGQGGGGRRAVKG